MVTDGYGQATVNIESVSARTVYPATTFDDVEYTFTQNGSPKLPTSVVGSTFTLETGTNWVVTVKGYKTVSSVKTLIAQGSSTAFTITNGGSTPVSVKLSIVDAVKTQDGTLTINITKPGDATITSLLLENMFDVTNPVITDENGNKTVPAGIYLLTVRLERTDGEKKFAGTSEIVYIYPYMTTSFTKTFNASDFSVSEAMTTKTAMQYFADEGITIGINVGNSLDAVDKSDPSNPIAIETAWGNVPVNQAYLNGLRNLGFKIVRIPVTWLGHTGPAPDYTIEETYLARVAEVVDMARNAGLKAFINIHHDGHHDQGGWLLIDHATANPTEAAEMADRFEKMWIQIADYFKNYGDWLMFQGFNEIQRGDWSVDGTPEEYAIINNWNQLFTDAVRGTGGNNASRFLLYYGYMTSKK
uniref:Glycoside hydrolase family 5 n=1 Tax=uncultured bacterium contig00063 TaxID=1181546 RepID=A0A806KCL4_9BACT|nr:glycoside hydrolase family 5 [uncultured bacterium contig00063]